MERRTKTISFCGSVIVDSLKVIPSWPEKGMLVPISAMSRAVGGCVCNDSIDLKTLDPSIVVKAVGNVGADETGAFAIRTMESKGIDCSGIRKIDDAPTTFTDVMSLSTTGERTFFNMHGADSRLTPDDIDVAKLDCDIFHLGYLLLLDGMDAPDAEYGTQAARLLAKVQAAGIRTAIDIVSEQSERFSRIVRPALRYCDYAVVNEIEASVATGAKSDDLRALCEGLMKLGVRRQAVVHCPARSASLDDRGAYCEVPSLNLPREWIKGTCGAGDAFCSGMMYAFLNGLSADEGMRLASCAAAANLAALDTTSGAMPLADTLELERRFGRK